MVLPCYEKLSSLLQGVTSKNNGDYYFISCPHSFRTENKFKSHENMCKKYDYCHVKMPEEFGKT